jgi:ankyrin repeat protein
MKRHVVLGCIGALAAVMALATFTAVGAENTPRLTDVIRSGDAARAMEMLKQGISADAKDADGTTALHWAVRLDDIALSRALLAAGAKVGAANRYGVTPLELAAVNGSPSMTELLLNAGADVNAMSGEGETVLMSAARTGRPEVLKLLLARGANPNAAERQFGETALMWAAGNNHGDAVRVLVAAGANPDTRSTVIDLPKAKVDFSFAVATALPRGGFTALMLAARQGQLDGVTALADAGANLNLTDPEGSTAIVIATINGHYDVAARLAEKGANSDIGDAAGMGALYAAVDMAHPASLTNRPPTRVTGSLTVEELVEALLKHGADPNVTLKAALLMRQHNGGDASLAAGATPLMRAAKSNDLGLMKILLEHRADPSRKLANGTTALSLLGAGRGPRVLTPDAPMFQVIQLMLKNGLDANTAASGGPLLHQNLDRGEAFVRMLVDHGAKLDLKDSTGRTPLDIALGVAPSAAAGRGAAPGAPAGPAGRGAPGARGGVQGARGGAAVPGRGAAPAAAPAPASGAADAATIAFLRERSSQAGVPR